MRNSWKKTAAFVLAFTLVAAPLTQTAGKGGLFGGTAITTKAAPPGDNDMGTLIGTVPVAKEITVSWDADEMNNTGLVHLVKTVLRSNQKMGMHISVKTFMIVV